MTASERAALEALVAKIDDVCPIDEALGEDGDVEWEVALAPSDVRALRSLLSSPPPASDERPSDPLRVYVRGSAIPMLRGSIDDLDKLGHRGIANDLRECRELLHRLAAAPAPDEGRPQEKKLASEAPLTVREPPDQGPMPTGCDGEGSREEPWDGAFRDEIQCPHCNTVDHEHTDYPASLQRDGDSVVTSCYACDRPMTVTLCAAYTYATEPAPASEAGGGETEWPEGSPKGEQGRGAAGASERERVTEQDGGFHAGRRTGR